MKTNVTITVTTTVEVEVDEEYSAIPQMWDKFWSDITFTEDDYVVRYMTDELLEATNNQISRMGVVPLNSFTINCIETEDGAVLYEH